MTAGTATPLSAPQLPLADDAAPEFRGFRFVRAELVHAPGVYIVTRGIGALIYPVLIGEAEDIAGAVASFEARDPASARAADGCVWMERAQPRQRAQIVRDLVQAYNPPLNVEHRTRHTSPDLAVLVPDRAEFEAALAEHTDLASPLSVGEAEIDRFVRAFYARASADPLIGPVFERMVADWEGHLRTICDFWSRSLLGTQRYAGNPFSAHIGLNLKPAFFARWLDLFRKSVREELPEAAADRAIARVEHMSTCFQAGLFLPEIASTPSIEEASRSFASFQRSILVTRHCEGA